LLWLYTGMCQDGTRFTVGLGLDDTVLPFLPHLSNLDLLVVKHSSVYSLVWRMLVWENNLKLL